MKLTYNKEICIRSGNCVKNLPSVFQVQDGKFTIIQDDAPEDQIHKIVIEYSSVTLKIEEHERLLAH